MIVAHVDGRLAFATRHGRGTCPACAEPVIARAGEIVAPHWAHRPGADCARATAPETEWHARWKLACSDPHRVEYTRGPHRADAISPAGLAIEFQHSPIEPAAIRARERHWRKGCWVYDGDGRDHGKLRLLRHPDRMDDNYRSLAWSRPRALITLARWPLWVDLGDDDEGRMLLIGRIDTRYSVTGYGWILERSVFTDGILNGWGLNPSSPPPGAPWRAVPVTTKPPPGAPGYRDHRDPPRTVLDWRDSTHWGRKHLPCRHCGGATNLLDDDGLPSHKTCAEYLADQTPAQTAPGAMA